MAATAAGANGPVVEVIDPATWRVLQRLQATGMLQLVGGAGRILHQAMAPSEDEATAVARIRAARAAELRAKGDRALRKAQVLVAGGFPEEAPALLAAAIGHAGAARLCELGEHASDILLATSAQIRDLVEVKCLPLQAIATLEMVSPATGAPSLSCDEIERLLAATSEVLAACAGDTIAVGPKVRM